MLRIKEYRIKKNLMQKDLAKLVGIHKVMLCRYESNTRFPSVEVFIKIAKVLGVDYNTLAGRN